MPIADLFPTTMDEGGVALVMGVVTAAVLVVIAICIILFARWSAREKAKRMRDVNTERELRKP